jgi:UDP-2,3-diacylglucosamine pyrophosphatase LpxH
LNGDIFDFDAEMAHPEESGRLRHVERSRSLDPTEPKSTFKMARIVADHPVFFDALRAFLDAGHRLVIVIGNHDVELYWPGVQRLFRERLGPAATPERLRFEPWFYQHGDVRFEHGHLLDPWCSVDDPRCPVVEDRRGERHVQVPFGNIASRYMLNRMGYFNPNCSASYQQSLWGYLTFWVRYHLFQLRPLFSAWLTGAFFTLLHAARVRRWRGRRGARLPAPYQRPVYHRWFLMLRELWLDRVAVVLFGVAVALGLGLGLGFDWWIAPALAGSLLLAFVWDRLVRRAVQRSDAWLVSMHDSALQVAERARAHHLVLGHSHGWTKTPLPTGGYYLNSGHFSASYLDIACNEPVPHNRTFLWLPPLGEPQVLEWRDGAVARLA